MIFKTPSPGSRKSLGVNEMMVRPLYFGFGLWAIYTKSKMGCVPESRKTHRDGCTLRGKIILHL